ncbi:MAG: Soluble epoxide hydrolase [Promethearchaeota archaeon]|nr:MAG: Soluble epoxide hydrolase [Candidatus Lokiarchaeota archaeon]
MSERYIKVNDINICYRIDGSGYPIFLIHGYGGRKEDWVPQITTIKNHYKVISYDNRCSGKTDKPNKPITMEMFSFDLKSLMEELKIEQANIIGRSLGGMITQQFLVSYPDKVNKAVLINTNYSGEMGGVIVDTTVDSAKNVIKNTERAFWENARFLYHTKFRKILKKNPSKKIHGIFSAEDLINNYIERDINPMDLYNQGYALKNFNIFNKLKEITKPVLLIGASHDRILPHTQMIEMHKEIPNSRLKILYKAGHGSPFSKAPEINNLILEFLNT